MALTQERLEYQREYRRRTGYAASKKYVEKVRDELANSLEDFAVHMWKKAKRGAKKRGIKWSLTKQQVFEILQTQTVCALSGRPVSYKLGDFNLASLDRIDSLDHYHVDNVQIVTAITNWMKRDWPQDVVVAVCEDITNYQKQLLEQSK